MKIPKITKKAFGLESPTRINQQPKKVKRISTITIKIQRTTVNSIPKSENDLSFDP